MVTSRAQRITTVFVHHPHVRGDTYEELVESLSRLADTNLVEGYLACQLVNHRVFRVPGGER